MVCENVEVANDATGVVVATATALATRYAGHAILRSAGDRKHTTETWQPKQQMSVRRGDGACRRRGNYCVVGVLALCAAGDHGFEVVVNYLGGGIRVDTGAVIEGGVLEPGGLGCRNARLGGRLRRSRTGELKSEERQVTREMHQW